jgi:uncharacterized SAM-binding protein YcdF (DUF218 family)
MFFTLSKAFWALAAPSNLIGIVLLVGAIALVFRRRRIGAALMCTGILAFALCGTGPVGPLLARSLENRFARPPADMPAPHGIIVLGGAMEDALSFSRDALVLGSSGTRMTEAIILARKFPQSRMVFTGGGPVYVPGKTEADTARKLFAAVGLPAETFTYEDRSRNTWENAIFTYDIVKPQPGQKWLLVTSATHMPRSMGIFRKVGFDVIAWPAHYLTGPMAHEALALNKQASDGLTVVDVAVKEYVGLLAYWATGKTSALFPAP